MKTTPIVLLPLFLVVSLAAATPEEERAKLREVAAEVAARRLVREHESGKKKAAESELAAARLLILKASEIRAREVAAGPTGDFLVDLKGADMTAVVRIWKGVFGFDVAIADQLKDKKVTVSVTDVSLEQFRTKLREALERNGVYQVWRQDGTTVLDSVPDKFLRK